MFTFKGSLLHHPPIKTDKTRCRLQWNMLLPHDCYQSNNPDSFCKIHKIMACLLVFLEWDKEPRQARMTEAKCESMHCERAKSSALSIFPLTCIPPCPNSVAYSKRADDHVSLIVNSCTCLCIVHHVGTMSSTTARTAPCMHWPSNSSWKAAGDRRETPKYICIAISLTICVIIVVLLLDKRPYNLCIPSCNAA